MEPHHATTVADSPDWQAIRHQEVGVGPGSNHRTRLWALTLDARSIPCQLVREEGRLHLLVPPELLPSAIEELRRYEASNRDWPPQPPPPRPLVENTLATLSVLILLASFHNISRFDGGILAVALPDLVELGSARAGLILSGEWWRIVTSLTLHADAAHLASNLAIGGVFVFLLCRELGSGLAWSLILASGALGNLLNALFQPVTHSSVGASTAVFGTVGILAALSQVRYRDYLRRRWLLPVASAVALLAVLGSEGKNTDLGAHLFGLVSGVALGWGTEWTIARRGHPGPLLNALLALLAATVTLTAWWLALRQG